MAEQIGERYMQQMQSKNNKNMNDQQKAQYAEKVLSDQIGQKYQFFKKQEEIRLQ